MKKIKYPKGYIVRRLQTIKVETDLSLQVVGVLVEEPDGGVIGVGHGVGGDEALSVTLDP